MHASITLAVLSAAKAASRELVSTINATGGVVLDWEGHPAPAADEDWLDLGLVYEQACAVLSVPMLVARKQKED